MSWHRILEFLAHLSWFYQTYCSSVERRGPWASCLIKEQIRKHVTPSTKAKMFSFLSSISRMCINFYLSFLKNSEFRLLIKLTVQCILSTLQLSKRIGAGLYKLRFFGTVVCTVCCFGFYVLKYIFLHLK